MPDVQAVFDAVAWYWFLAAGGAAFITALVLFVRVPHWLTMLFLGIGGNLLGVMSVVTAQWYGAIWITSAWTGATLGAVVTQSIRTRARNRQRREAIGAAMQGVQ